LITTPCLVGLNVLVFVVMVASGISLMTPNAVELVKWGANYGPLTLGREPWRLVTSMFVHIGLLHVLFNMWCLWGLGTLGERLLGSWNLLVLYLLSGVGGGILSLAFHPHRVSAGASGAIFGIAGGLIATIYVKKTPISGAPMKQTLKSLVLFVGYNLLYGMRGGIDNMCHLGGLVSGLALGLLMPARGAEADARYSDPTESSSFNWIAAGLACALLVAFVIVRREVGPLAVPLRQP
jgi:rhomboid protease GluP